VIYFDHNATAPLHPAAKIAWLQANEALPGNPSSPHRVGARADTALSDAREKLAAFLGCSPLEIVWTSGASESSNTIFHHFAGALPLDQQVWISAIEHPCVLDSARQFVGPRVRLIPVTASGVVSIDWITRELGQARPELIAVMAANNETGIIQPWREVLSFCREHGVPFFCDAVQWIGKMPAAGLGHCDFVSGSAHKFGGPKGVGFLKCPRGTKLAPLIFGGPQEDGRRAGTENVPGVLAMLAALEAREAALATGGHQQAETWRCTFEQELLRRLPGSVIVGSSQPRLWNTVSAIMPQGVSRRRWVVKLDKLGFAVSTGSACSSGKEAPSHVLAAIGFSPAQSGRVLRFSSGWETPESDWDKLLEALEQLGRD
jgi:cysteine desulfurase